ncbi:toxin-antitoxin system YwqK family antitoxin [Porphyromonas sp.]|uniref:toxin-antitoxin system YwqK family antitoxin n=1 Tax=Porphyromonas sp. TaxID=1924944 RepID=UPI0039C73891
MRRTYKRGKLDGLYEEWYDNGQLKFRVECRCGRPHGLFQEWYDTGELKSSVMCNNGEIEKQWRQ